MMLVEVMTWWLSKFTQFEVASYVAVDDWTVMSVHDKTVKNKCLYIKNHF